MNIHEGNCYRNRRQFQMCKKFLCNPLKARDDPLKTKETEKSFQTFSSDTILVNRMLIKIRNVLPTCKSLLKSSCEVILFSIWLCHGLEPFSFILFKWE